MPQQRSWINRQVSAAVAGAGSLAGNVIYGVGNGVSGAGKAVGNSVTNTTRGWADGVRSTGNNVKDATTAGGPRAQTAQNPLGLTRGPLAVQTDRYAKSAAQSRAGGAPSSGGSVKFF